MDDMSSLGNLAHHAPNNTRSPHRQLCGHEPADLRTAQNCFTVPVPETRYQGRHTFIPWYSIPKALCRMLDHNSSQQGETRLEESHVPQALRSLAPDSMCRWMLLVSHAADSSPTETNASTRILRLFGEAQIASRPRMDPPPGSPAS